MEVTKKTGGVPGRQRGRLLCFCFVFEIYCNKFLLTRIGYLFLYSMDVYLRFKSRPDFFSKTVSLKSLYNNYKKLFPYNSPYDNEYDMHIVGAGSKIVRQ
jgi:hypothetical protein